MIDKALMRDLVTEEIEAVMRERDEAGGLNTAVFSWRINAFERAFSDPAIKREAVGRALGQYDRIQNPPPVEPDQRGLFGGEE